MSAVNNFDHYRVFYYVAVKGNMGKAAEELGMVPSSITKIIRALEQELDCQLFIRSTRGVIMTIEGKTLFERVKPAFSLLRTGEQEIQALRSLEAGRLVIGVVGDIIPNALISRWLMTCQEKYPKLKIEIVSFQKSIVANALNSGEVDLVLYSGEPEREDTSQLKLESFLEVRDVAIVGGKYSHIAEKPVTLAQLHQIPLVFASDRYSGAYQEYKQIYREHGLDFEPQIKTSVVGMQVNAVHSGLGYSFIPEPSIWGPLSGRKINIVQVTDMKPHSRTLFIATSPEIPLSRAASAFIEILRADKLPCVTG